MKFLYTRKEVEKAIHDEIAKRETERYWEERYRSMEKEIDRINRQNGERLNALMDRVFDLEMGRGRRKCNCKEKVGPVPTDAIPCAPMENE